MSYNQPVKIDFSYEEIGEIKKVIAEVTLEMMENDVVVVFQNVKQDTPIYPCSVHPLTSVCTCSHLQYRLGKNSATKTDVLIPAMMVVKIDSERKDAYPWPVRVVYALLHEYSHVKTVASVRRVDGKLEIDQEDCEYQCVKYMHDYILQRFDSVLAEKLWLFVKVVTSMYANSHYNKSWMWMLGLQDFEEENSNGK